MSKKYKSPMEVPAAVLVETLYGVARDITDAATREDEVRIKKGVDAIITEAARRLDEMSKTRAIEKEVYDLRYAIDLLVNNYELTSPDVDKTILRALKEQLEIKTDLLDNTHSGGLVSVAQAFEAVKGAMKRDIPGDPGSYAHTWHCNIACACSDVLLDGIDIQLTSATVDKISNKVAARFMKNCFGVDTKQ